MDCALQHCGNDVASFERPFLLIEWRLNLPVVFCFQCSAHCTHFVKLHHPLFIYLGSSLPFSQSLWNKWSLTARALEMKGAVFGLLYSAVPRTLPLLINPCLFSVRAGQSGDRIPVGARFSAPVQTDLGAQPASCNTGTGSLSLG